MPATPTTPTLTDGAVTLRLHEERDVEGIFEQCTDAVSQRWTRVPVPYLRENARTFALEIIPAGWADGTSWGFAVDVGGRFAGSVELRNWGWGRAEIAYGAHPWARGTGHMLAALRLLVDWGFAEHDLKTIVWRANKGNWASRKLAWRLGFSFDGTVRGYLPQRGELHDGWIGTLLRSDDRQPKGVWLETPVLTDGVVRLRPPRSEDTDRIVEAAGDERTQRWLGRMPSPYTSEDAAVWLEQTRAEAAAGTAVNWVVTDLDDLLLGSMNLFDIEPGISAEVGFWAHPDARGRGVTTRAAILALRYGFVALGLVRIQGHAAVENAASRHALEAAGLLEAGVARLGTFIRPEGRVDAMKYDVLVEEWHASQAARAN
jgi:RimJ/RimL family protein N-acetyltransferase